MTEFQAGLRRQAIRQPQRAIKTVLLCAAVLLALAWTGAWLLDFREGTVVAASLVIVFLGLLAIATRVGFGIRDGAMTDRSRLQVAATLKQGHRPSVSDMDLRASEEPSAPLNCKRWSLDVFAAIDAQRFAAVCETWFSWAGFDTRSKAHRTNEGVDIWLHAARMPGPVAIVRCKHWLNKPVGLQDMKEFGGLMANFQSAHGTYTTTSTYTPEALQFAKEHGIDAVDGRGLLRRIQTRTRQRQQALLAVAYSGQS